MTDHLDKAKKLVDAGQHEVVQSAIVNCELSAIAYALIAIAEELRRITEPTIVIHHEDGRITTE